MADYVLDCDDACGYEVECSNCGNSEEYSSQEDWSEKCQKCGSFETSIMQYNVTLREGDKSFPSLKPPSSAKPVTTEDSVMTATALSTDSALTTNSGLTTIPGTNIFSGWEYVTPQLAEQWLAKNLPNNRHKMPSLVDKYATDMREGDWLITSGGIGFDENGNLTNGQHRLSAIMETGLSQWFLVMFNLPVKSVKREDTGKGRNLTHQMTVQGFDGFNADISAMIRVMMCAPDISSGSRGNGMMRLTTVEEFYAKYSEQITKARKLFPREAGPALFKACIAKALFHLSEETIARFTMAVMDTVPLAEQTEVDREVRRKMPELRAMAHSSPARPTAYRKFQRLLAGFAAGEKMTRLYEATDDLFPLPEEGTESCN